MSKLNRTVDGQTIQFVALPKIFQSLNADLPSGKIALPSGEIAYWRLQRNLTELKKHRRNIKELANKLLAAFKTLVKSSDFLSHYGLTEPPKIPTDAALSTTLRTLLQINTNRVDYSTITVGKGQKMARVETIEVALGNLVYFNAVHGAVTETRATGIRGKLMISPVGAQPALDEADVFDFNIFSPVIDLTDRISPDRLRTEIINKIQSNLPRFVGVADLTFNDGQFDNYLENSVEGLSEKFGNKPKNKRAVVVESMSITRGIPELPAVEEVRTEITNQGQLSLSAFNGLKLTTFLELADAANFLDGSEVSVVHDETEEVVVLVASSGAWVRKEAVAVEALDITAADEAGDIVVLTPSDFNGQTVEHFKSVVEGGGVFDEGARVFLVDEHGGRIEAEYDGKEWTYTGVASGEEQVG